MITIIAAYDEERGIGKDNTLPWHIPADLAFFKRTTLGHPIVMGRKTYESLPKRPLPGRVNLVVTSGEITGVECFSSIRDAIDMAKLHFDEIFIIGGQSIYEQTIDQADRMLLTHVTGKHEANFFFPDFDHKRWYSSLIEEGTGFQIREYSRLRG